MKARDSILLSVLVLGCAVGLFVAYGVIHYMANPTDLIDLLGG